MGEVANTLAGVTAQLGKAKVEILDRLGDLEARLAEAGKLDADDRAALDAVKTAAADLDGIVPDAVPDPALEVPAEEPTPTEPPSDLPPATA